MGNLQYSGLEPETSALGVLRAAIAPELQGENCQNFSNLKFKYRQRPTCYHAE